MRIISWNVNGIRSTQKSGELEWLFKQNPDIICLQEVKATVDQLPPEIASPKGYYSFFDWPREKKGYSGVAIYTKEKPVEVLYGMGIEKYDKEGRLLAATYKNFVLINCYFPNGGGAPERLKYKLGFYEEFLKFAEKLRKKHKNIIFCGDVNVAHTEIDIARPKENANHVGFLPAERKWVDEVIAKGYVDTFRHNHPNEVAHYTWWDQKSFARNRNIGWRIDYFFVNKELIEKVRKSFIWKDIYGSDHCPIELDVAM